jgi:starch synthase
MAYPALAGGPRPGLVTTIHNLAFQGWFPATILGEIGLPLSTYHLDGVEFHGGISFLKAALQYADRITTVSHTYAEEIQRPESGFGLDGLLRARRAVLSGIVNGIDNAVWNPTTDPVLPQPYDRDTAAAGKAQAKMLLQQELGLEVATDQPLIVLVGRLTVHKGAHLLAQAMPDIVAAGAQLAVLGTGAHDQEAHLRAEAAHWPHRVAVRIGFDERLAHLFQAAADITLVPSLTEPCGLTQLYAQHYGSLPLVRRVGGLADTVVNAEPEYIANHTATGFLFNDATPAALAGTVRWALDLYRQHPEIWVQMRDTAMQQNFGWEQSARAYQALYQGLQSR